MIQLKDDAFLNDMNNITLFGLEQDETNIGKD